MPIEDVLTKQTSSHYHHSTSQNAEITPKFNTQRVKGFRLGERSSKASNYLDNVLGSRNQMQIQGNVNEILQTSDVINEYDRMYLP